MEFKNFKILETFCYYDGPLIFSTKIEGKLFLAYAWNKRDEFIFLETNENNLKELAEDKISIRDFFRSSYKVGHPYKVQYEWNKETTSQKMTSEEVEAEMYVKENVFLNKD